MIYAWLCVWMLWDDVIIWCSSLPFRWFVWLCGFPPLQWSSILLMWADVRTLDSDNDSRDAAAWGLWMNIGPTMGPIVEGVSLVMMVLSIQGLELLFSPVYFCLGRVGPLSHVIWVYLAYCTPLYSKTPYSLNIHVCDVLLIWGYLVFGMLHTIFYLFKYDIKLSHKNMILYFYKFGNNMVNNIFNLWSL